MLKLIEKIERRKSISGLLARWLLFLIIFFMISSLGAYLHVQFKYRQQIISAANLPKEYRTAMVFGAGLKAKGTPGAVLADRLLSAIDAYQLGKIDLLLLSGDNSTANHNEVVAMKNLALEEGLSEEVLLLDHSGLSTYESCWRAKNIYQLDKIVLITQKYHLKRALYDCNEVGLSAVGIAVEKKNYPKQWQYSLREIPASVKDFFRLLFFS